MKQCLFSFVVLVVALSACGEVEVPRIQIIPQPGSVELSEGVCKVAGAPVSFDAQAAGPAATKQIVRFADDLSKASGRRSRMLSRPTEKGISFAMDSTLGEEAYEIEVDLKNVKVTAGGEAGTLYAIQSLRQMLPVGIYNPSGKEGGPWVLPCCTIKDEPRFSYRGMHKDDARHIFPLEEVKRYLDVMAMHKMNRMHWHLSDDQGWRIEIKKYPRLTEIGAYRDSTRILRTDEYDGRRYGGYFTQEEIREVVEYAADLGITVIPEIDLPGHMLAALAAYPELGCTGGPYAVWPRWGISDQVLCPGKEITFEFIEGVLDEVMELFPSEYIHIGGDECPKSEWKKCPDCQKRIKDLGIKGDRNHSAEQYLQNYVTARVQEYVNSKGRKIIGWDEVLEGNLAEGATIMSWRGVAGGLKAARMGFDVIMTPNTYAYIDYYQSEHKDLEPYAIGGYLPVEKVYSYEPYEGLGEEVQEHILGVQANLWTEFIGRCDHLEYMLLPRLDAISEVQWCEPEAKDFDRFKESLVNHLFPIYDRLGYSYSKAIIGEYGLPGLEGGTNF